MLNFKLYSLLESILNVDNNFEKIITNLSEIEDPVANLILGLISTDIKTNLNYLKPSDNNQDIFFVNDSQVQRIKDKGENPFNKAVNKSKIGRAVQQILKDNGEDPSPQEIEKFVNNYKNMYDQVVLGKLPESDMEVVSGRMISYWYDENNYFPGGGTLNNSCMRYDQCQDYFGIYENNPDVCKMIILKDSNGNGLLGRALLWKLANSEFYLDRIYTRFDKDVDIIYNYFKKLHPTGITHQDDEGDNLEVKLKYWDFKLFPYMDSLYYLNYKNGLLTDLESKVNDGVYFKLRSTEGDPSVYGGVWSERLEKYLDDNDAIDIGDNDYVSKDMCQWSEYEDRYVFEDDVIETDHWGILDKNNCFELEKDGEWIWVPMNQTVNIYQDGKLVKYLEDDVDLEKYIPSFYQKSKYTTLNVYAKEEDCIILGPKRFVVSPYIKSLIEDKTLIELNIIDVNFKDLLNQDKYLPIIDGMSSNCSYIPTMFKDIFDIKSKSCRTYTDAEDFWDTIFPQRDILVTDVLSKYPTKYHNDLMEIHNHLKRYNRYSVLIKNREFLNNLDEKFNKIRLLLNDSNIKEDIFRISILAKNWSGKIPTNFIQDFNIDEFRLFKNLYIYQYSNPDEFSDDDLQEKIINYYFPIWQRIVFYMYLTGGYNRERFLKHFLDNYIIIDRQDLKICLEITYDEYEIGKHLYNNSNFFHNHLLSSEERLFFEGIGYNIIDKLFNLYKEKEGF